MKKVILAVIAVLVGIETVTAGVVVYKNKEY